jgi:hypothetical protein
LNFINTDSRRGKLFFSWNAEKLTNKKQMLQISSIFFTDFFRRLFLDFKIRFFEPRRKKADKKKKKSKFNAVQF